MYRTGMAIIFKGLDYQSFGSRTIQVYFISDSCFIFHGYDIGPMKKICVPYTLFIPQFGRDICPVVYFAELIQLLFVIGLEEKSTWNLFHALSKRKKYLGHANIFYVREYGKPGKSTTRSKKANGFSLCTNLAITFYKRGYCTFEMFFFVLLLLWI